MSLHNNLAIIKGELESIQNGEKKPEQFVASIAELKEKMTSMEELGTDIELGCRLFLENLLVKKAMQKTSLEQSGVLQLLNFAIDYALLETSLTEKPIVSAGKLPYLLLEDVLEGQSLEGCKEVWTLMEARTAHLTTNQLFQRGKLILLRLCNSLLRRLSKTSENQFCGRVLLYLAAAYPLSERSAINVTGKANTGNVTFFEEEEEFRKAMASLQDDEEDASTAGVEETKNESKVTNGVVGMDTSEDSGKTGSGGGFIDYPFYQAFWGIQSFFCDPNKGSQSKPVFDELISSMSSILTAFEGNSFSDMDQATARERFNMQSGKTPQKKKRKSMNSTPGASLKEANENRGLAAAGKYLTDSRLLRMQLSDPQLRLAYLTQFLIISQHICLSKPQIPATKPEALLKPLETRARTLILQTPPNGKEYLEILEYILTQERHWVEWKATGCKPYEKYPDDQLGSRFELNLSSGKAKRHKRPISLMKANTLSDNKKLWTLSGSEGLMGQAARLAGLKPALQPFLEPYEEAMDPEAGIEDEYHPKSNPVYCWRALRLLSEAHLSLFMEMSDGDIGKGIIKLCQLEGRPVPGEPVVVAVDENAEEGGGEEEGDAAEVEVEGAGAEPEADMETEPTADGAKEQAEPEVTEEVIDVAVEIEEETKNEEGGSAEMALVVEADTEKETVTVEDTATISELKNTPSEVIEVKEDVIEITEDETPAATSEEKAAESEPIKDENWELQAQPPITEEKVGEVTEKPTTPEKTETVDMTESEEAPKESQEVPKDTESQVEESEEVPKSARKKPLSVRKRTRK